MIPTLNTLLNTVNFDFKLWASAKSPEGKSSAIHEFAIAMAKFYNQTFWVYESIKDAPGDIHHIVAKGCITPAINIKNTYSITRIIKVDHS